MRETLGLWLVFFCCCALSCAGAKLHIYLNSWAVRVPAGTQAAQRLARKHGLLYLGQVRERR